MTKHKGYDIGLEMPGFNFFFFKAGGEGKI
jgi:hypothetical protein